jgi:hypothetical protein
MSASTACGAAAFFSAPNPMRSRSPTWPYSYGAFRKLARTCVQ